MNKAEVIIVGAGAAGLMAAYTLSKAGKKVLVLEARNRIGGRIHTLAGVSFFNHAELGAEFIHGNLPVTMHLLKAAGIDKILAGGEMWQHREGKLVKSGWDMEGWGELMQKLHELKHDISIGNFLAQHFAGAKYDQLRNAVTRFVSGYDTADPFKASAFALREEWGEEDDDAQYRIKGGYGKLLSYLEAESREMLTEFCLNSTVKKVEWGDRGGRVILGSGITYAAEKVIIALPLGVLKADNTQKAAVTFDPLLEKHLAAVGKIGFGAIIKLLLKFKNAFWQQDATHVGFVLSDEAIPTWWTQHPSKSTVLTGWLGGLPAEAKKDLSDEELLHLSLQSLANIFDRAADDLKSELVTWKIANWTADPFTLGSYAYDTVESHDARNLLSEPVADTIYFAGEYLYEGPAMGTVEAALSSGLEVAKKIIN